MGEAGIFLGTLELHLEGSCLLYPHVRLVQSAGRDVRVSLSRKGQSRAEKGSRERDGASSELCQVTSTNT